MRRLALFLLLLSGPAGAWPSCEELWFTRNLIFDRAGYCFGSELGQSVFANHDCTTTAPVLSAEEEAMVEEVRILERDYACEVDTSASTINITNLPLRLSLDDIPIPTWGESGCIGYLGDPVPLYAGRNPASRLLGELRRGDDVLFGYIGVGDWEYVWTPEGVQGWVEGFQWENGGCEMYAG